MDIQVKTCDDMHTITLRNTAFVLQFYMNVVSLNKFVEKNVYWNTESCELTYQGVPFCAIEKHYD